MTREVIPPIAAARPETIDMHGDSRVDEYHWLHDRDDPQVLSYLDSENRYTEEMMRDTLPLQEELAAEMQARFKASDVSVPQRLDDFLYYYRTARELQYPIYCRKRAVPEGPEEVILDLNDLAEGHDYFALGAFRVSQDHSLLAYAVDTSGSESFTIRIRDLSSHYLLPDSREGVFGNVEWSNDGASLFYVAIDATTSRPFELRRFRLGTSPQQDTPVYREPDPSFFLSIRKTKTRKYLLLEIESHNASEVRFLEPSDPLKEPLLIEPRREGVEYTVDHHNDRFVIASDLGKDRRRLFETPESSPGVTHWSELPVDEELDVDEIEVFKDHMVIGGRKDGLPQVLVVDSTGSTHYLDFDEPSYAVDIVGNPEYESTQLRLRYSSLVTPHSILDYHLDERRFELLRRLEIASGFEPDRYQTERILARSEDGTVVPITVGYRKDLLTSDGRNPAVLSGYGAYGESSDPEFSLERLSLLDRGVIFAIAHTRGGGEFGNEWHEAGRLLNKKKTFEDFIACAEHLIKEGYSSQDRLVADGRSAGGLLLGASLNMRPDLFKAALADVPFVDVVNTMLDPDLPLTEGEFDEWGDPREEAFYDYIKSYSPYDGVRRQNYPNLLVTTSLTDARVPYWEPAKWVARLRTLKTDQNLILLRVAGAGHAGATGRLDYLREEALRQAFVFKTLEMDI